MGVQPCSLLLAPVEIWIRFTGEKIKSNLLIKSIRKQPLKVEHRIIVKSVNNRNTPVKELFFCKIIGLQAAALLKDELLHDSFLLTVFYLQSILLTV